MERDQFWDWWLRGAEGLMRMGEYLVRDGLKPEEKHLQPLCEVAARLARIIREGKE